MVKRIRPRTRPNKTAEPSESNLELFGPPQLLHGEDIKLYEELLGRMAANQNKLFERSDDESFVEICVGEHWF